jgi:hypothetical protein
MKFLGGGGGSLIGAGVSLIGGLIGAGKARRAARRQARQAAALNRRIESLEANRQAVINPYANVKDLSSMVSNPFENLQVATAAAEMRAQEQDISLATTLDTLRATGSGAGGATALAQAASRSKANIAADIQKQEAQNARLRAQGEQQMQQLQMREAARVQQAEAQGKAFMFGAQERRDVAKLNRLAGQQQNAAAQAAQLRGQASAMTGQALGSVGNILGAIGGIAKYNQYLGDNTSTTFNTPRFITNMRLNRYRNSAQGALDQAVSNLRSSGIGDSASNVLSGLTGFQGVGSQNFNYTPPILDNPNYND